MSLEQQYKQISEGLFSPRERRELFSGVRNAVLKVKDPHKLSARELDGQIYTNLRREFQWKEDGLAGMTKGQQRYSSCSHHTHVNKSNARWAYIQEVINVMKKEIKPKEEESLVKLELALSGMQESVTEMVSVNRGAEQVIGEVADIHNILHGDENEQ